MGTSKPTDRAGGASGGKGAGGPPSSATSTLAFTSVEHVVVQVFARRAPPADEWARFVDFEAELRRLHGDQLRAISFSDGGAPSHEQSEQLMGRGETLPLSLIFTSTALRFTVAVITLRVKNMRTFSPNEMDAAFAHLGLRPATIAKVWGALPALAAQVGGSKTVEAALAARKRR